MFAPGTEVLDTRSAERVVIERELEGGEYLARRVSDDERVRVAAGGLQAIGGVALASGGIVTKGATVPAGEAPNEVTTGGEVAGANGSDGPVSDEVGTDDAQEASQDGDSGDESQDDTEESGDEEGGDTAADGEESEERAE